MTTIQRIRVEWTGSALVGPSASTFLFVATAPSAFRAALLDLYSSMTGALPNTVQIKIPTSGEELEDSTGVVSGVWTDGTVSTVTGLNTGNYSKGVGARISWDTPGLTNNRRVRGSTFLVPLAGAAFDTDGTLNGTFAGTTQVAINAYLGDVLGGMVIWTKPIDAAGGKISEVTAGTIADRTSWLRSRRT